jgi:hypothetical protein
MLVRRSFDIPGKECNPSEYVTHIDRLRPVLFHYLRGLAIWQGVDEGYRQRISEETSPAVTLDYKLEDEGIMVFRYPDGNGVGEVLLGVSHTIVDEYPDLGDRCRTSNTGPWHDYKFKSRQYPHQSRRQRASSDNRVLEARFVHPVDSDLVLDRAVVVGRLATVTAGWTLPTPEREEYNLIYNGGMTCEYTAVHHPGGSLLVTAQDAEHVSAFGMYDAMSARAMLQEEDEPGLAQPVKTVPLSHEFHVNIKSVTPEGGRNLQSTADDLAAIAIGPWRSL